MLMSSEMIGPLYGDIQLHVVKYYWNDIYKHPIEDYNFARLWIKSDMQCATRNDSVPTRNISFQFYVKNDIVMSVFLKGEWRIELMILYMVA